MGVNKKSSVILMILCVINLTFSQKKEDVYFVLNDTSSIYAISQSSTKIGKGSVIYLMNKQKYVDYEVKKEKMKKKGVYILYSSGEDNVNVHIPTMNFEVVGAIDMINTCELKYLRNICYKWLQKNSWVENNPNVLFKDLYFLLKTKGNKYLKYKVRRVLVEY